mgnify:CR=1 FL=1
MSIKRYNQNFSKFILYTFFIIIITILFLSKLTIKNECVKTQLAIENLHKLQISNSNIVKQLQSNKEFLMSEKYISEYLSNEMTVATPETLLIEIR